MLGRPGGQSLKGTVRSNQARKGIIKGILALVKGNIPFLKQEKHFDGPPGDWPSLLMRNATLSTTRGGEQFLKLGQFDPR